MRYRDLLRLALAALWQQKVRTALTALGVVLGACMLTLSLSVGTGVQEAVRREFNRSGELRHVQVYGGRGGDHDEEAGIPPAALEVEGEMSSERRQRLRRTLVRRWNDVNRRRPPVPLTTAKVEELKRIDHVESVVPAVFEAARVTVNGRSVSAHVRGTQADNRGLTLQLVAGALPPAPDSRAVLVHEFVLYQLGVRDDAAVTRAIGRPIRLEVYNDWRSPRQLLTLFDAQTETLTTDEQQLLEKATQQLPGALDKLDLSAAERERLRQLLQRKDTFFTRPPKMTVGDEFALAGVFRSLERDEVKRLKFHERLYQYTEVVLPYQTAAEFVSRLPRRHDAGFDAVSLRVDREENVRAVVEQVEAAGVEHYSAADVVDHVLREIALIRYATTFIAGVALLVAGLGITNTMVTSVLERTQEIGIMKAVGAKDRHIQLMFLVEGAVIGLLGGGLGLLAAWLISIPGDDYARKLMEQQTRNEVETAMFVFPAWLVTAVPLFAVVTTTLAALYPARRAARVDPIAALRHE